MIIRVGEKVIGEIEGDVFIKKVSGSKHRLKSPPAWAVDANSWDNQISPVCKFVQVYDREQGKSYWSTVANFNQYKGLIDRGFEPQYFLALNRWVTEKPVEQLELPIEETPVVENKPEEQCLSCAHIYCATHERLTLAGKPIPNPCLLYHKHR